MSYLIYQPDNPRLQPYIEYYNSFKGNGLYEKKFISLPEGKIGLVFMLGGRSEGISSQSETNRTESHISGLIQVPTLYSLSSNIETFSVVFKAGALHHFIPRQPVDELAKSSTSLYHIFGEQIYKIEDQLSDSICALERVAIVDKFLLSNMKNGDVRIRSTVKLIDATFNSITISDLSAYLNIGNRQLRNIFSEKLGMSPKQFIRLFRFKNALGELPKKNQNNSQLAVSLGYYDESHFIQEFKSFAGMTPSDYFKNKSFISDFSNFSRLMLR